MVKSWTKFAFVVFSVPCNAFSPSIKTVRTKISTKSSNLRLLPGDATEFLEQSQTKTVSTIASTIQNLKQRPDLSWEDGFTIGGCPARLAGYEAPGTGGNIAWLASMYVSSRLSSLTIFNGPLTNVPHLVSRCNVLDPNTLAFHLDFRPRAYGAYEKRDADGNYPGPEELGRVAFEYSGNRMEYESKFATPDVINFIQSTIASFDGSTPNNRPLSELDIITRGPFAIDVVMPLTDSNVAAIASAREQAANYWLTWATSREYDHRPGAPINAQYVYDTKYKQNCYGAVLRLYSELFGEADGMTIASSESGPLDEAYVGGAS